VLGKIFCKSGEFLLAKNTVEYAINNKIEIDKLMRWNIQSQTIRDWLAKYVKNDKNRLSKLGAEFLDEVYMQMEQMNNMRT